MILLSPYPFFSGDQLKNEFWHRGGTGAEHPKVKFYKILLSIKSISYKILAQAEQAEHPKRNIIIYVRAHVCILFLYLVFIGKWVFRLFQASKDGVLWVFRLPVPGCSACSKPAKTGFFGCSACLFRKKGNLYA